MRAHFRAAQSPVCSIRHNCREKDMMGTHFGLVASAALVAVLAWSPPVVAQQKTFRQCREEWAANKAAVAASGKTQRVFVAECRGGPLPQISPAELGRGQYGSEAEDPIVWVNLRSKVYHESGSNPSPDNVAPDRARQATKL